MPRQNRPRTVPFESHVAANLARERERAGHTYEWVADRMTERGCPIQPSALHKIEKGDPPRRITVNELMVLADVLGMKPFDLVDSPNRELPPQVWQAVREIEDLEREIMFAEGRIHDARQAIERVATGLAEFIGDNNQVRSALRRWLAEDWANWPELRRHLRPALRAQKTSEAAG